MKLHEITSSMLAQASGIYLRLAYPHDQIPPHVRKLAAVDPAAPLEAILRRDGVETQQAESPPGFIEKYRWRLGNERYPHMKLGIERCSAAADFVFNVDTHDRNIPFGSPALNEPAFHQLLAYNSDLKRAIEAEWGRVGLPTFQQHITRYLHQHCDVGGGLRKTVLIVDDDASVLELEEALVEEAGYRVIPAAGGLEALAAIERPGTIDLCLLDIMMPTLDGLAVARRLRDEGRLRFPVIYVTALPADRARDDIAAGYVGKPFDPDHLIAIIRQQIG